MILNSKIFGYTSDHLIKEQVNAQNSKIPISPSRHSDRQKQSRSPQIIDRPISGVSKKFYGFDSKHLVQYEFLLTVIKDYLAKNQSDPSTSLIIADIVNKQFVLVPVDEDISLDKKRMHELKCQQVIQKARSHISKENSPREQNFDVEISSEHKNREYSLTEETISSLEMKYILERSIIRRR